MMDVEDCGGRHDWSAQHLDVPRRARNRTAYGEAEDKWRTYLRRCRDCGNQQVLSSCGDWVDD